MPLTQSFVASCLILEILFVLLLYFVNYYDYYYSKFLWIVMHLQVWYLSKIMTLLNIYFVHFLATMIHSAVVYIIIGEKMVMISQSNYY